jgi:hypothetical protein
MIRLQGLLGESHMFGDFFLCSACGGAVITKSLILTSTCNVVDIYLSLNIASYSITEKDRNYLNQAYESVGTPDGVVMLASSAVDAMLKDKGYVKGSLYQRIEDNGDDHLITK